MLNFMSLVYIFPVFTHASFHEIICYHCASKVNVTPFFVLYCLMVILIEKKDFLAIRWAISLNKTFVLFCLNKDWRH